MPRPIHSQVREILHLRMHAVSLITGIKVPEWSDAKSMYLFEWVQLSTRSAACADSSLLMRAKRSIGISEGVTRNAAHRVYTSDRRRLQITRSKVFKSPVCSCRRELLSPRGLSDKDYARTQLPRLFSALISAPSAILQFKSCLHRHLATEGIFPFITLGGFTIKQGAISIAVVELNSIGNDGRKANAIISIAGARRIHILTFW